MYIYIYILWWWACVSIENNMPGRCRYFDKGFLGDFWWKSPRTWPKAMGPTVEIQQGLHPWKICCGNLVSHQPGNPLQVSFLGGAISMDVKISTRKQSCGDGVTQPFWKLAWNDAMNKMRPGLHVMDPPTYSLKNHGYRSWRSLEPPISDEKDPSVCNNSVLTSQQFYWMFPRLTYQHSATFPNSSPSLSEVVVEWPMALWSVCLHPSPSPGGTTSFWETQMTQNK